MQCICKKCQKSFNIENIEGTENLKCLRELPEMSKPEESHFVEFGTSTGISFMTSAGKKKMEAGKKYDQELNEI